MYSVQCVVLCVFPSHTRGVLRSLLAVLHPALNTHNALNTSACRLEVDKTTRKPCREMKRALEQVLSHVYRDTFCLGGEQAASGKENIAALSRRAKSHRLRTKEVLGRKEERWTSAQKDQQGMEETVC